MTSPPCRQGDPEDFDAQPLRNARNNERISVGWGNLKVSVRGLPFLVVVILAVALAYIVWTNQRQMQQTRQFLDGVATLRSGQAAAVTTEHKAIQATLERTVEEVAWILTLPEGKRAEVHQRLKTPERFR